MKVRYVFARETKNMIRFEPADPNGKVIGALYVSKDELRKMDESAYPPDEIEVDICVLEVA